MENTAFSSTTHSPNNNPMNFAIHWFATWWSQNMPFPPLPDQPHHKQYMSDSNHKLVVSGFRFRYNHCHDIWSHAAHSFLLTKECKLYLQLSNVFSYRELFREQSRAAHNTQWRIIVDDNIFFDHHSFVCIHVYGFSQAIVAYILSKLNAEQNRVVFPFHSNPHPHAQNKRVQVHAFGQKNNGYR